MSTVQPPPPAPPATVSTPVSTQATLSIQNPPSLLTQLSAGTTIEAQVIAATNGKADIITPLGRVIAETTLPLKAEQPLVLQIPLRTNGGTFVLQVIEIAGKPIQPSLANTTNTATEAQPGTSQAPSQIPGKAPVLTPTTLTLTTGSTLQATIVGTAPASTSSFQPGMAPATPANTSATPPGTGMFPPAGVDLAASRQAAIANTPSGGPSQPAGRPLPGPNKTSAQGVAASQQGMQTPQNPFQGQAAPQALQGGLVQALPGTAPAALPGGTQFSVTIQSLTPPQSETLSVSLPTGPQTGTVLAAGQSITGIVISVGNYGHSIVQVGSTSLSIATSSPLPPGTEVTFKIASEPVIPDPVKPLPAGFQRAGMIQSQSWPSLDDAMAALQTTNPQIANHITAALMPKPNVQFTATTLFFLTALSGGDIKNWLGDTAVKLLERLRPDTIRRLSDDFRLLGRAEEDPAAPPRPGDWRGTLIPLHTDEGLQQIRFFTRKPSDDEDENDGQTLKGTRFLIDLNLSNIGRFQLDGMIEKSNKRLDMIIRSKIKLPEAVRQNLMTLFSHANDVVGLHGGMSFQAAPDAFIDPESDSVPQHSGVGITV